LTLKNEMVQQMLFVNILAVGGMSGRRLGENAVWFSSKVTL
jgi:hypothetical protein